MHGSCVCPSGRFGALASVAIERLRAAAVLAVLLVLARMRSLLCMRVLVCVLARVLARVRVRLRVRELVPQLAVSAASVSSPV